MLIQRITTALILAPLFIWAVVALETNTLQYILIAITILGAWEYTSLIKFNQLLQKVFIVALVIIAAIVAIEYSTLVIQIAILWWMLNLYWVISYPKNTNIWYGSTSVKILTSVLLLVPMLLALIGLHQDFGYEYFLLLIFVIWGADSGAYFIGRAFGKNKLAPKVSPGKSIEGVFGGIGFAVIVMLIFLQYKDISTDQYLAYILLSVVTSSVSVLGDLFESLFKRVSGIKDSSNILPGHGGVLDRIDSLTVAAPFFVLGLSLL